ncbi:copper chaperone PCu(A)C [Luteimonas sp. BDR2-5]|uniref:copper chaperone PCu(A)C n=1 Tax=Proluteimonas luteida TaxID=2878685 RepID=UPI001E5D0DDE|nr:copper chaperone PCu(A)C [Luteimonas sp. BDR2-5]MCD9028505.1 copper chaperone PCu(A)C [Luteimonas sp. BDR2-5]
MPTTASILPRPSGAYLAAGLLLAGLLGACSRQDAAPVAQDAAGDAGNAAIVASDAWVRQPPPSAAVAGAYLTLRNDGATEDRLVSVTTDAAERVEIHEMRMADGMMRMRELADGLVLPAGAATALAPGGNHLMLINPQQPLEPGTAVDATLTFERAGPLDVTFDVRPLSGEMPATHGAR